MSAARAPSVTDGIPEAVADDDQPEREWVERAADHVVRLARGSTPPPLAVGPPRIVIGELQTRRLATPLGVMTESGDIEVNLPGDEPAAD